MDPRYVRTSLGQTEIQQRTMSLSRPVRNLLLVINADKPVSYWLEQVRGCTPEDLQGLVEAGLLAPAPVPTAPPPASSAAAPAPAPSSPELADLQALVRASGYAALYEALSIHAKEALGLVAGYRFVLEVERCSGVADLQAVGLRYVQLLADKHGPAAVKRFTTLLKAA
jgi:hypothetical protein